MKAILLSRFGNPDILQVVEQPDPFPGEGEVRVKLVAIGLNYMEVLSRKGQYGWAPPVPYIPGIEAYGEIDMLGDGVKDRKIGQKVIVGTQFGAYAQFIVVKANQTRSAIRGFTPEENAAFAVHYLTAWAALFEEARIRKGDVVLVHAAAGGVGSAAVQLLKHAGCHVIGAVGSDAKCKVVKKLGADFAVNYSAQGWEKLVHQKYPNGVNVVLCLVSGRIYEKSRDLLAPLGKMVVVGLAGLDLNFWNPISIFKTLRALPWPNIRQLMFRSYGVSGMHLGSLMSNEQLMSRLWEDLTAFTQKHKIHPLVGAVFKFDHMPQAHRLMESRESTGKIVVKLP